MAAPSHRLGRGIRYGLIIVAPFWVLVAFWCHEAAGAPDVRVALERVQPADLRERPVQSGDAVLMATRAAPAVAQPRSAGVSDRLCRIQITRHGRRGASPPSAEEIQ